MEVVPLFNPFAQLLAGLSKLMSDHRGMYFNLEGELKLLLFDLELRKSDMVKPPMSHKLQELAYDIEYLVRDLSRSRLGGFSGFSRTAMGLNPIETYLRKIKDFREMIERLHQNYERERQTPSGEVVGGVTSMPSGSRADDHAPDPAASQPFVGIEGPISDIQELLLPAPQQLKVISIVGYSGVGKTTLAKAVYDNPARHVAADGFHCKAWVVASENSQPMDLLNQILQQVVPGGSTIELLQTFLAENRCLVVVDNMVKTKVWKSMLEVFPTEGTSRIIVTTTIEAIATFNIRGSYRYRMQGLNDEDSKSLFHHGTTPRPPDSKSILSKCDGSPRSLVSVREHLGPNPDAKKCENVCRTLGTCIADAHEDSAFWELKRALLQSFDNLTDNYHLSKCLLSVSMFPNGHQINTKSLLRIWAAEELVHHNGQMEDTDVALQHLRDFVDRSIIEPVLFHPDSEVKTCKVQGTILEFIVHRSISTANFLTLVHKGVRLPMKNGVYHVRRLSVHDSTCSEKDDLSYLRWLKICNRVPFDFSKCSQLLVLDLEGSKKIDDSVLANICKLVFLKYLSLRRSDVKQIPAQIRYLEKLETLDIRETRVEELHIQVIMMSGLLHLFGRFKITPRNRDGSVKKILRSLLSCTTDERYDELERLSVSEEKSRLQTLAGVVVHKNDEDFQRIMAHATKLKKVKLWCNTDCWSRFPLNKITASDEALESLSINYTGPPGPSFLSKDFLDRITGGCPIKSMKLSGRLEILPPPRTLQDKFAALNELQLFSTELSSTDLSALQILDFLVYLKLSEPKGHRKLGVGSFHVQPNGFLSLRRLCIEAPKLPPVRIEQGAMPHLTSLQLLYTGTNQRSEESTGVEGILHLAELNEVILHQSTSDGKIQAWKNEANRHINKPYVRRQPA